MRTRILAAVLLAAWLGCAKAAYPDHPIRFIVPSAPGGSVDVLMRILTQQLAVQMGVPFVVDNKPGGSYVPGTMDIVKAVPDGYTLGYGNIVSLASNDLPVRSVQELIDYAKKNPGKLTNGSSGNGTTGHLGGELFKSMTGISMLHAPYKGSPQAINDLVAGRIQVMFDNVPSIGPHVKAGRVRGIGVSSLTRAVQFPQIPAIAETVPGYQTDSWGGVIGPAKLPAEIVQKLTLEIRKALASREVAERYRILDTQPDGSGPAAFVELVRRETRKWADVVGRSGAKVD
jgi:tripartite-type tricarboxylate transporter receptor subunit TctC